MPNVLEGPIQTMLIDLEPDAHCLELKHGDPLRIMGQEVFAGSTRIGRLPTGLSIENDFWRCAVAETRGSVHYAGRHYPLIRVELLRRNAHKEDTVAEQEEM